MSHPPNETLATCSVDDCCKPVEGPGRTLCRGHRGRKQRSRTIVGPLRQYGDPARTFAEAMFAVADAADSDEDGYYRAWKRACAAGRRYFGLK